MLKRLKAAGLKTAILSNGSPDMLDAAVHNAGIGDLLDAVLSVEPAGVYKPHPKVYQFAVDRLAIPARAIMFQSSNAWDAHAASAFGMRVVWCNRHGQRPNGCRERRITRSPRWRTCRGWLVRSSDNPCCRSFSSHPDGSRGPSFHDTDLRSR